MVFHYIVPPYLLEQLEQAVDDPSLRARFRQSLQHDAVLRTRRATGAAAAEPAAESGGLQRAVYDAENRTDLPGTPVRAEGEDPVQDESVNQAYDGTGATWTMFRECFGRDSIDGDGLALTSSVHYDRGYANAFWDGAQMVFGDGDGEIFGGFTGSVDVTGHELTHGVTQYTANLAYEGQSGALNESISDVFGSLAKQHNLGQSTEEADWLIGAGLFQPGVQGVALRSMKAPGTAYDDPRLGRDPQPAHMSDYIETEDDNGGVHLNSGIPNRAFYLTAAAIGGNAYDDAGKIWYETLTSGTLSETATFAEFAEATQAAARELFGGDSSQLAAVTEAWQTVGVLTAESSTTPEPAEPSGAKQPASRVRAESESEGLMRAAKSHLPSSSPPAPPTPPPVPSPTPPSASEE
ncbi:M4 family metallopeptidase [Kribbella sp. NPDC050241]|uniref:M4 family metallopeptidase n=1 Tax=Kribbella sp. NPDC050241 TaxID=3364115 RepID=UPI0037BD3C21